MKIKTLALGGLFCAALAQAVTQAAPAVTGIAVGWQHSILLKSDGSVWTMGDNTYGQLGDGSFNKTNHPEMVVPADVTAISAGSFHNLLLKKDGSLWAMGENGQGELGDGTYNNTNRPEMIVPGGVTAIAAGIAQGDGHSLFLKSDGSLWAMGANELGQLGDGTHTRTNQPEMIVPSGVTAIAAGGYHSLFLQSDGTLWGMGRNDNGELGLGLNHQLTGSGTNRPTPLATNVMSMAAGGFLSAFIKNDGTLWVFGDNYSGQTNQPFQVFATNATAMSIGYYGDALLIESGGSLWQIVEGQYSQFNQTTLQGNFPPPLATSNVVAAADGPYHSLFLKRDGSLWAMGQNGDGQLGDGTFNSTSIPEEIFSVLPGFNQMSIQLLNSGAVALSYVGYWRTNYALDRTLSLSSPVWTQQATNAAGKNGSLVFTNVPVPGANNFWRIRMAQ